MKYIMKVRFPSGKEANDILKDPMFGKKMQDLLAEVKAEAAYFTTICGSRGAGMRLFLIPVFILSGMSHLKYRMMILR